MRTKLCTDTAQSKWLIQHGLDPKTADMGWFPQKKSPTVFEDELDDRLISINNFIPAWSFTTLMRFMPSRIDKGRLAVVRDGEGNTEIRYGNGRNIVSYTAPEPVDAAVPMMAFLLLNKHINTNH